MSSKPENSSRHDIHIRRILQNLLTGNLIVAGLVSQPHIHTHSHRAKLCGINRVNFKINRQIFWAVYILFCGSICAFSRSCFCLDYFNVFCGVSSLGVPKWMRPAPSFCWTGWVIRYFSHFQCTKSARSQIKTSFELYIRLHTFLLISSHLQNWLKYKEIFTIYSKINANYSCFIPVFVW